jgi:hypothetical protein
MTFPIQNAYNANATANATNPLLLLYPKETRREKNEERKEGETREKGRRKVVVMT